MEIPETNGDFFAVNDLADFFGIAVIKPETDGRNARAVAIVGLPDHHAIIAPAQI